MSETVKSLLEQIKEKRDQITNLIADLEGALKEHGPTGGSGPEE
jgi:hypothetical protein